MEKFFCIYCGQQFSSIQLLTGANCMRHPNGALKGKHVLYEGSPKTKYNCKYCGQQFSSIMQMTGENCMRHPNGTLKGKHSPAL